MAEAHAMCMCRTHHITRTRERSRASSRAGERQAFGIPYTRADTRHADPGHLVSDRRADPGHLVSDRPEGIHQGVSDRTHRCAPHACATAHDGTRRNSIGQAIEPVHAQGAGTIATIQGTHAGVGSPRLGTPTQVQDHHEGRHQDASAQRRIDVSVKRALTAHARTGHFHRASGSSQPSCRTLARSRSY